MVLLIAVAGVLLTTSLVLLPARAFCRDKDRRELLTGYRLAKLCAVRRYYPQLRGLSIYDIERRYDVERLYQSIGRY